MSVTFFFLFFFVTPQSVSGHTVEISFLWCHTGHRSPTGASVFTTFLGGCFFTALFFSVSFIFHGGCNRRLFFHRTDKGCFLFVSLIIYLWCCSTSPGRNNKEQGRGSGYNESPWKQVLWFQLQESSLKQITIGSIWRLLAWLTRLLSTDKFICANAHITVTRRPSPQSEPRQLGSEWPLGHFCRGNESVWFSSRSNCWWSWKWSWTLLNTLGLLQTVCCKSCTFELVVNM